MVYHPGKVLKVFPAQGKTGETAATVRFWDNNLHTVKVAKDISARLKENNTVLVDYYPFSEKMNRPKMEIVNIVNEKDEKGLWTHYREFFKMKHKAIMDKRKAEGVQVPPRSNVGVG